MKPFGNVINAIIDIYCMYFITFILIIVNAEFQYQNGMHYAKSKAMH